MQAWIWLWALLDPHVLDLCLESTGQTQHVRPAVSSHCLQALALHGALNDVQRLVSMATQRTG